MLGYIEGIMRRQLLLGISLIVGDQFFLVNAAPALDSPANFPIDGGPLGTLQLSGGMDGYLYDQTGTSPHGTPAGSADGDSATGVNLSNAVIGLQKTSGLFQFTLDVGPVDGLPTLGLAFPKASLKVYRASPVYLGYITIAPANAPVTISVGQINSLEGYEGGLDWQNANIFTSSMWDISNQNSLGVSGTYTKGPLSVSIAYGDGWDTRVFNFLQASFAYNIGSANSLDVYYGGNLGRTGANAITYFQMPVGAAPYLVNSQTIGIYDAYTRGNITLTPELQYVYAKPDHWLSIDKYTGNFSAAVFGDYTFGTSPYSIGAMASYFDSVGGQGDWYIAPRAAGIGVELTPTWQRQAFFARLSVGYVHLINMGEGTGYPAYGTAGNGRNVLQSAFEAGVLF
jgi:Putative beta-barrel porin-2, OmpL-like. bbp2